MSHYSVFSQEITFVPSTGSAHGSTLQDHLQNAQVTECTYNDTLMTHAHQCDSKNLPLSQEESKLSLKS